MTVPPFAISVVGVSFLSVETIYFNETIEPVFALAVTFVLTDLTYALLPFVPYVIVGTLLSI